MKDEIEESKKIMKDWFKQYYEKPEKVTSFMLDQEDRIKELETINEEHRKINGELRKTINEAISFVESMKYCGQEDYFYDEQSQDPNGNDNMFEESKTKLLNILQGKSDE